MIRILDVRPSYPVTIGYNQLLSIQGGSVVSVDGSTSSTGITLLTLSGKPLASIRITPDVKNDPIIFKLDLKRFMEWFMLSYTSLIEICYEEPVIEYLGNVKALFGLRTAIPEILVEQKDVLNNRIKFIETPNGLWKRIFLAPAKMPNGTNLQKEAVRNKLIQMYPWVNDPSFSEDECDSMAFGIAYCSQSVNGLEDQMQSSKKITPFKFNARIIGANSDDDFMEEFVYRKKQLRLPKRLSTDIELTPIELPGTGRFDKHVFKLMGSDDKLLVVKFKSKYYAPIRFEYDTDNESLDYDYAYALIWRNSKKSG